MQHARTNTFESYPVEQAGTAAITRKPGLVMRDPQQAGLADTYELPSFQFANPMAATAEANRLVEEARATAEQMVSHTRAACEADLKSTRERGFSEGYQEGIERADQETASLIATAERIAVEAARERASLLQAAEGDIVELAIAIAQRLVNASIDVEPERVVDVCRGAMRRAFQREVLTVLAHPDDLELLRTAGPQLASELGGIHQLDFVEERRLDRGGVIIRTPAGEIDATFDGKAQVIEESLRELISERAAEWRNRPAA